jgi:DNA-directed RNA polymerase subunit F
MGLKMETQNIKIKEAFDFMYIHEKSLTSSQKDFIASLQKFFTKNKSLSEKQQKNLFEIKKYLNVSDQPVRFSKSLS